MAKHRRKRHYKRNPGFPIPMWALLAAGAGVAYWYFNKDKKPETAKGFLVRGTHGMLLGPGQSAGMGTVLSGRI